MKQVSIKNKKKSAKKVVGKKKYGTSKLEKKFASEFLDKFGIEYIYQFEAKDIGRFYDFYLPKHNLIIEVDGDYYHSYNVYYEKMSPTQNKNKRVDKIKDEWALINGIPILRIWEHDINSNKSFVIEQIKKMIDFSDNKNAKKKKRIKKII